MLATTADAIQLFHEGSLALAEVEAAGMRVDVEYLDRMLTETAEKIKEAENELKKDDVYGIWRREFGDRTNLGSRNQLGKVLKVVGFKIDGRTLTGKTKVDEDVLSKIKHPFAKGLLKVEKLKKLNGTYLKGLRREVVGDRVRPSFNLHLVWTMRCSADSPNLLNIPVRNPEISKIIRSAFIPSKGNRIVEVDFKAIEVAVSCTYNQDPVLIEYVSDPSKDMHRDVANKLFFCQDKPLEWWKQKGKGGGADVRYVAKNCFVFPGFYGSYYIQIAQDLWDSMEEKRLAVDNIRMRQHLEMNGISELGDLDPSQSPRPGTFEKHVKEYENWYWNTQYTTYTKWKKDWHQKYIENGYVDLLTGFRLQGLFERNQILNAPIQGAAFHLLLWVLNEMIRWIRKNRMKSRIVCEIYDSVIADSPDDEYQDYLGKIKELVTEGLPKRFPWINVPLTVEAEITETFENGGNWHNKKEVSL